ncbi:hypothetical protein Bbelb_303480 [Branchiostoma belcheri]|nr:hypothetical protein Bbelb_303480 [Branchiostoma belcheri]
MILQETGAEQVETDKNPLVPGRGSNPRPNLGTSPHADALLPLGRKGLDPSAGAMEEYREDFAFEESIENEAVCQIRKQSYEKRTVKVIKHLSLLQQDFCTRLPLRAVRTEESRHHCN